MKKFIVLFFLLGSLASSSHADAQKLTIPTLEIHGSVNRPIAFTTTFFGGGFGANVVFRDTRVLSFKTGLEVNFFRTWNNVMYIHYESYKIDALYSYWDLSIPFTLRWNMGKKARFFVEAGGYLGIPLTGNVVYTDINYSPPGIDKPAEIQTLRR